MKYLLGLIFIYLSNQSYAITVEDILHQHGKNKVVSVLSKQFESQQNTKLTIDFNGAFKQMHRPSQEYITAKTIKKDLDRLGIKESRFNDIIIKNLESKNREKLRKLEALKVLKYKQVQKTKELSLFGFEFDGWQSGMSISAMKQIVRKRQLPMSPGYSTFITGYNQKILNSQPAQRNYTYRTKLMGKMTTITLSFTKNTKKLYQVKSIFHITQDKPEERKYFYDSLYSQLTKKYGQSTNIEKKNIGNMVSRFLLKPMIGSLLLWKPNKNNNVTLNYKKQYHLMSSYELIYKNIPLGTTNKNEIALELKQRTDKALLNDNSRF